MEAIPGVDERNRLIAQCALDDIDRRILVMRYAQCRDFSYIADEIGMSYACVIKRHRRALADVQNLAAEWTKNV